jgi:hypothetical protein
VLISEGFLRGQEFPPGFVVDARVSPGICAAGRIIRHQGMRLQASRGGAAIFAPAAEFFRFAFYSRVLVRGAREPYDHSGAAYLPLSYDELHATEIPGYGRLLIQRTPERRPLDHSVSDDGILSLFRLAGSDEELGRAMVDVARMAGVPAVTFARLAGSRPLLSASPV